MAIKIKVNAGMIVHTISISWPSIKERLVRLLIIILIIIYRVIIVIIIIIIIEWSWKKAICSIIGEFMSGNDNWDQVIMCYFKIMLFWLNECSAGGKFNIHSIEELVEEEKLIIFFWIIDIQIIIIKKITPVNEIILPIEDIKFHFEKKSG